MDASANGNPPASSDNQPIGACPVRAVLDVIGGKWKILILWQLTGGACRYSDLNRRIPDVSERMLVKQLGELVDDGLVARTSYPEVPPRVEYALTETGASLTPLLNQLAEWGLAHLDGKIAEKGERR
jgi:DNA-binding HxlR family transcriptional regulator